jgi:phosphoglycolate phosphatase
MVLFMFDLDGTLFDARDSITNSVKHSLAAHGLDADDKAIREQIGKPIHEIFRKLTPESPPGQVNDLVKRMRERFQETYLNEYVLFPNVKETLETLFEKGNQMVVVTVKPEVYANGLLNHFGLGGFFKLVMGNGIDNKPLGKTELLRSIASKIGGNEKGIMVGDTIHDVKAAKGLGFFSVGVSFGYGLRKESEKEMADMIINDFSELLRLV